MYPSDIQFLFSSDISVPSVGGSTVPYLRDVGLANAGVGILSIIGERSSRLVYG